MSSLSSPDRGDARRGVALLGAAGSIGGQAVEVLAAHPELFHVVALATRSNGAVLQEQAKRLSAEVALLAPSEADLVDLATRDARAVTKDSAYRMQRTCAESAAGCLVWFIVRSQFGEGSRRDGGKQTADRARAR